MIGGDGVSDGDAPWQAVVRGAVRRWTGLGTGAAGAPATLPPGDVPARHEALLRDAGFVEVASYRFVQPHVWTADSILGYLRSTSFASRHALGDKAAAFEAELRAALLACDAADRYPQHLRFGYTFARAPEACRAGPTDR